MPITDIEGNLLDQPLSVIIHQANLFHSFGGGIAFQIGRRFPEAAKADKSTRRGSEAKLGDFSIAGVTRDFGPQLIVNLYSQMDIDGEMVTSYDHLFNGLAKLRKTLEQANGVRSIGFPHGMGCGIATGNWHVVRSIIEAVFEGSGLDITIVKFKP